MISEDRFYYNLQQRGIYGVELEPIIKVDKLVKTYDDFNDFTTPILFCLNKDYAVTLSRDSLGRLW